jgi:hypothetical protein
MNKGKLRIDNREKSVKMASLQQALLIMIPTFTYVFKVRFGIESGINRLVSLFVLVLFISQMFSDGKLKVRKSGIKIIGLLGFIMTFIIITLIFYPNSRIELKEVVLTVFIPILVMVQDSDGKYLIKYLCYLSLTMMLAIDQLFQVVSMWTKYFGFDQIDMGVAYAVLPCCIAAGLHFYYFRKERNILILLAYALNIYCAVQLLMVGNRGVVINIIICIFFVFLNSTYSDGYIQTANSKQIRKYIMCAIVLIVLVFNLSSIIGWIAAYFRSADINFGFIYKFETFLSYSDIDNGRSLRYEKAINGFLNNPIWGQGIQTFEFEGAQYPHNYILQFIYEGGIFFGIPFIILSLKALLVLFSKKKSIQQFVLVLVLSSVSIFKLLFSSEVWANSMIWMLVGYSVMQVNWKDYFKFKVNDVKEINQEGLS